MCKKPQDTSSVLAYKKPGLAEPWLVVVKGSYLVAPLFETV